MKLQEFSVERYKGYAKPAKVVVAPLTILVGPNNAGKTALARAIPLLAGGLAQTDNGGGEPLPLKSCGISHGTSFEDLVTRRDVHGSLKISVVLEDDEEAILSLSATVQNVVAFGQPPERQIRHWRLGYSEKEVVVTRQRLDEESPYDVSISGKAVGARSIKWRGILPRQPDKVAEWAAAPVSALGAWAGGIRYLRCPRRLVPSPFRTPERSPDAPGSQGENAPLMLAADRELSERVREWFSKVFGVSLSVRPLASYSELLIDVPAGQASVQLSQSGRGISNVLSVVVLALTAQKAGHGVDLIEHPEAELHPHAHAEVAELLLDNLAGPARPMIVETHSEMLLLRARRWIAEGKLPADHVVIYWVDTRPGSGSELRKIRIDERGEISGWPDGVFSENYEEILAIRRAARAKH